MRYFIGTLKDCGSSIGIECDGDLSQSFLDGSPQANGAGNLVASEFKEVSYEEFEEEVLDVRYEHGEWWW